ncbi:hypothetical protein BGZ99_004797 [Dissophora globulifera]|uniref:histone acetyltransferase n=1 Tax=Dissophora globulifera TaxID=979702 RepID=A0A9P6RWZ2_9FUNG|nr:hypothetical protein BGZ99_004797 [Dissophora globulifera]
MSVRLDSSDPVLRSIAQELIHAYDVQPLHDSHPRPSQSSSSGAGTDTSTQEPSGSIRGYEFQLESFLTRPRLCQKLFPPHVQKLRYKRITVQERLILLSVGPSSTTPQPTTAPPAGKDGDDKSATEVNPDRKIESTSDKTTPLGHSQEDVGTVLVAGLEVLEYTLIPLSREPDAKTGAHNPESSSPLVERIVYIAKVDTSGCWPLPGLEMAGRSLKSPARALVSGYLKAVRSNDLSGASPTHKVTLDGTAAGDVTGATPAVVAATQLSSLTLSPSDKIDVTLVDQQGQQHQLSRPDRRRRLLPQRTSLFIFARAQPQYLFAKSAKNRGKHVLDDRGLVRWWKNMVASVYDNHSSSVSSASSSSSSSSPRQTKLQAWWLIPGIETERQALNVVQSSLNSTSTLPPGTSASGFGWQYGYPDKGSKEMAHTLIPQFPDDPKSRMMKSPSCAGGFVNIHTFWELVAIGEESGAGKITGFFRVVEEDVEQEQEQEKEQEQEQEQEQAKDTESTSTSLTGVPTTIRAQSSPSAPVPAPSKTMDRAGSGNDYTGVINFLLSLDFSTAANARDSTKRWTDRLDSLLVRSADGVDDDKSAKHNRQPSWIQRRTVSVQMACTKQDQSPLQQDQEQPLSAATLEPRETTAAVHTLGAGLIKRKAPASDSLSSAVAAAAVPAVNVLSTGLIKRKVAPTPVVSLSPPVNVLSSSLIKRKSATTASQPPPMAPVPSAEPVSTLSSESPPSAPIPSTATVNVLGASFIKKRKVDS